MTLSPDEHIEIVIPTFNSAATFELCLSSLRRSAPLSRIIVIDNNSVDATPQIAAKFGCEFYEFSGSLGEARMKGISLVTSDWFLFVDSDIIIDYDTISKLAAYRNPDVGAVQAYPVDPIWCGEAEMQSMPQCIELTYKDRGLTCCTLVRTDLVRDIDLTGISAFEDKAIKDHILGKGYKWLFVKVPVTHLADRFRGNGEYLLKARWAGASMRRTRSYSIVDIIKGVFWQIKKRMEHQIDNKRFLLLLRLSFEILLGYLFMDDFVINKYMRSREIKPL